MWEHYKKTFMGLQAVIGAVTLGILIATRHLAAAGLFFATMQVGAVVGAAWAARLRAMIQRQPYGLPVQKR